MKRLFIGVLFVLLIHSCVLQLTPTPGTNNGIIPPIEEAQCLRFKKNVFEKQTTFSFFMHGAPEMTIVKDECKSFAPFIVNGTPARPKEFPHIARIGARRSSEVKSDVVNDDRDVVWFCGGTLISGKYVLTAAHCFFSKHGVVNVVRLGELDFNSNTDDARPEDVDVEKYIPHPDYDWNSSSIYNDIGLIELKRYVTFSRYIVPACLPFNGLTGDEVDEFIAIGWGSTQFASEGSSHLLKVKLQRFTYAQCAGHTDYAGNDKLIRGLDSRSQLCAGSDVTKDTCNGDSGGPLLAYHPSFPCMYLVMGVTSTGISGCGSPNVPGIYTRVSNYSNWIIGTIWR